MSDLDALLAGIVAEPSNAVRWLVMADWLEENGQPERAELVRVHRELLRTCTDPDAHPDRPELHARMMELMRAGVQPCIPEKKLFLPGGVQLKLSFIPPGSFLMGSPETEEERDENEMLHLVTLRKGFWLGQAPVTQAQWVSLMGENPSEYIGGQSPVETVSWDDTQAFCAAVKERTGMKVRLPTEAEWEYAARAGTTTPFYWGEELNGTQANFNCESSYGSDATGRPTAATTAVGSYAGVSPHPWGLVDVTGNVWEWCGDWSGEYAVDGSTDPVGPEGGSFRVYRGGSRFSQPEFCRLAYRGWYAPHNRDYDLGFRIAADLE